jgi:hypothetical protein
VKMPALTIHQPWASLIVDGVKVHETRSWRAPRELIGQRMLVHAGATHVELGRVPFALIQLVQRHWPNREEPLPYGALVGSVLVTGCRRTDTGVPATADDRTAGDWRPGRWAWVLAEPRAFKVARPIRGERGLWYVTRPDLWRDD